MLPDGFLRRYKTGDKAIITFQRLSQITIHPLLLFHPKNPVIKAKLKGRKEKQFRMFRFVLIIDLMLGILLTDFNSYFKSFYDFWT